ncbi:MAG: DMT family transporter [Spirochaetaceae bacterium]|jgi:drug/metabolite transporter (DMT)-like permease|nr:DMT family transporter [Spirochaetaceae bacterium]
MDIKKIRADLMLLLTACIWGFGFVAQRSGMEYVGPFTFNGVRFILGSCSLLPLIGYRNRKNPLPPQRALLFRFSLLAGTVLFLAVTLQQLGMMFTTAGNAGFITGMYVIIVPIFGIVLGRKTGPATWLGAVFTLVGLYCISAIGNLNALNPGDIIMLISAVFWAFHVLIIDRQGSLDPIKLSCGQFLWCGIFSLIMALSIEPAIASWAVRTAAVQSTVSRVAWRALSSLLFSATPDSIAFMLNALVPILYGGLASVGIAYTLQVVAQRDAPPAHATIILCLEGCFAASGGILLLKEPFTYNILIGFVFMFSGLIISQWELIKKH